MNASPTNTTVTAELACPEWCMTSSLAQRADWDDNLWHICGDSYKHSAQIEFGERFAQPAALLDRIGEQRLEP